MDEHEHEHEQRRKWSDEPPRKQRRRWKTVRYQQLPETAATLTSLHSTHSWHCTGVSFLITVLQKGKERKRERGCVRRKIANKVTCVSLGIEETDRQMALGDDGKDRTNYYEWTDCCYSTELCPVMLCIQMLWTRHSSSSTGWNGVEVCRCVVIVTPFDSMTQNNKIKTMLC